MGTAIETRGLRKVYRSQLGGREIVALTGLDLSVERGEIFGLLGPNGAGKTTTVKILLGLTNPTAGEALLLGIPASRPESRRRVGYLPEGHRFPGYLTARQTLSIFGRMSGVPEALLRARIPELLERLRIADWADIRVKKFSKGMTQRLGLASALVHEPEVLLLDEPTDGVDPVGRREIRDLLREVAARGTAILLNSHLLSEVEMICDRVIVLRKGAVAAQGRITDLTASGFRYRFAGTGIDDALLSTFRDTGAAVERVNGHVALTARDAIHLNALLDAARSRGVLVTELTPFRSSLEDVFVDLVRAGEPDAGKRFATREVHAVNVLRANVEEVFREASARWTLLAYAALSTLFVLLFAAAVNLDIVDGALAGARLFGKPIQLGHGSVDVNNLVLGFESGFSGFLYVVATFLAVFATAHLVPRLQEKGTIDLYLSRPVGRVPLLVSRYVGGLLLATLNVAYLVGAMALIIWSKTGVLHPRFLLAAGIILFTIATLMAFAFLVGVVTSSTAVSIMSTFAIFFAAAILGAHSSIEAAVTSEWAARAVRGLYWTLPKTAQLAQATVAFVSGGEVFRHAEPVPVLAVFGSTALFGLASLSGAAWLFSRKDF